MMVMMMAMTPSLKASNRLVFIVISLMPLFGANFDITAAQTAR
jgi:hypothetical protein